MSLSGIKISEIKPYNLSLDPAAQTVEFVVNVANETFRTNLNNLTKLQTLNIVDTLNVVGGTSVIANLTIPTAGVLNATTGSITNLTNSFINSNRGTFSTGLTGDLLGTVTGNLSGNARTAGWLNTTRTFRLTGDIQSDILVTDLRNGLTFGTQIQANTISNSNIRSDASIAGTKIVPTFEAQNITATGTITLSGNTANNPNVQLTNTSSTTNWSNLLIRKSRGTTGPVVLNDVLGGVIFEGLDNQNTYRSTGRVLGIADGTPAGTSTSNSFVPGALTFQTSPSAGPAGILERMRISSAGLVGINSTAPTARLTVGGGLGIGDGSGISTIHGARRSIQINTDNLYGGTNDNHSGYLIYTTLPSSWGSGTLTVAKATDWGVYDTANPVVRILGLAGNVGGLVGINIASPIESLDVSGTMRVSAKVGIGIQSSTSRLTLGGETEQFPIALDIRATGHATSRRAAIFTGSWLLGQDAVGNGTRDFFIYDSVTAATRFYIQNTTGNIGINTIFPTTTLDVNGSGKFNGSIDFLTGNVASNAWIGVTSSGWTSNYLHIGGYGGTGLRRIGLFADTTYITGKIGINRNDPTYTLDVLGNIRASGGTSTGSVALQGGNASNPGYIEWYRVDGTTRIGYMGWSTSGANNLNLTLENGAVFSTNGGSVGINCTNPSQIFEVGGYARIRGLSTNNNTYTGGGEFAIKSNGATNDPFMSFHSQAGVRQGYIQFGDTFARIRSEVGGVLYIGTNTSDDLYLTAAGYLGLGISPSYQLQLSLNSAAKPTSTTWTVASDVRLKEDIALADTSRCLEIVKTLPLKRYTWKDNIYNEVQVKDRTKIGWIAQDVQQVFPKGVTQAPMTFSPTGLSADNIVIEDCLSLDADQIYAALYGAVQEVIKRLEVLESKI